MKNAVVAVHANDTINTPTNIKHKIFRAVNVHANSPFLPLLLFSIKSPPLRLLLPEQFPVNWMLFPRMDVLYARC